MIAVLILTAVVLDSAVVWKLYQFSRAPRDRTLRSVTLCLLCVAISFSLGLPAEDHALDALVGDGTSRLLANVLLLWAVYWLLCFYLYSVDGEPRRVARRARWEAVPLAVTVVGITLAMIATPAGARDGDNAQAAMRDLPVASFYVLAGCYLVYSLTAAAWWTRRFTRQSSKPLSTGLRLTGWSLAGMAAANLLRVAGDITRWRGAAVPVVLTGGVSALFTVAVPLFVTGISYPSAAARLAAARVWWQHWQTYRRLGPLWRTLHQAFPEDALNRTPAGTWREYVQVTAVHRRYYRRVVECRDGLVRISPYLAAAGLPEDAPLELVARMLGPALEAYAAGRPVSSQAVGIALPAEDTLAADTRQLVAVSTALGETRRR